MISNAFLKTKPFVAKKMADISRLRFPSEACGVILGDQVGERATIMEVCELSNVSLNNKLNNFKIDPLEMWRCVRDSKFDLIGFWHSHPHGSASMSSKDLKWAWPKSVYAVVSSEGIKYWKVIDGRWKEINNGQ